MPGAVLGQYMAAAAIAERNQAKWDVPHRETFWCGWYERAFPCSSSSLVSRASKRKKYFTQAFCISKDWICFFNYLRQRLSLTCRPGCRHIIRCTALAFVAFASRQETALQV